METHFKQLPACSRNRPAITCMQEIVRKHHIQPDEIEGITVRTIPYMVTPIFSLKQPKNAAETFSSYPWNMAMIALGISGDQWELPATLENPRARALAQKVELEVEPRAMEVVCEQLMATDGVRAVRRAPTTVEVRARGKVFSEYQEYGKGDPSTPETRMTDEEMTDKFRTHTRAFLPADRMDRAIAMLHHLDTLPDIRQLLPSLVM